MRGLSDLGPALLGWIISAQDPSQQKKARSPGGQHAVLHAHQGNSLVLFASARGIRRRMFDFYPRPRCVKRIISPSIETVRPGNRARTMHARRCRSFRSPIVARELELGRYRKLDLGNRRRDRRTCSPGSLRLEEPQVSCSRTQLGEPREMGSTCPPPPWPNRLEPARTTHR